MNKNESKYFNTAKKMDEALIALLEKKEFSYITVKEICETAGVNRSTFYLHYENTSDLLNETTQYILDRFSSYFKIDRECVIQRYAQKNPDDLVFITPEYLTPYLTFIRDNQRIFRTALKEFGSLGFDEVYQRLFIHIFDPILERFEYSKETRNYVMKFYLTGITAVVMEWIGNDCNDSIDTVADIIIDCIFGQQNNRERTDGI